MSFHGHGERALTYRDDAALHFLRWQAVVGPDDGDEWDVDIWVDIFRGFNAGRRAKQQHQERNNYEGVGPA